MSSEDRARAIVEAPAGTVLTGLDTLQDVRRHVAVGGKAFADLVAAHRLAQLRSGAAIGVATVEPLAGEPLLERQQPVAVEARRRARPGRREGGPAGDAVREMAGGQRVGVGGVVAAQRLEIAGDEEDRSADAAGQEQAALPAAR